MPKYNVKLSDNGTIVLGLFVIVFIITNIFAYLTHIVWSVKALMADATVSQMVLAVAGTFLPPIGVIHGWVVWFS